MNEYLLTPYCDLNRVGDTMYLYSRAEAIKEAKKWLEYGYYGITIDEADLQVIYDYKSDESELADVWWSITREGIAKHDGTVVTKSR